MNTRRLNPETDRELMESAYHWDAEAPQWYQDQDQVFRSKLDRFLESLDTQAEIGIFDGGEMVGLLRFILRTKADYEVHLCARRGANVSLLYQAMCQVRDSLFRDLGARKVTAWIAKRNRGVRRLCYSVGLRETGFVMIHGMYRGRCIEWQEYTLEANSASVAKAA